MAKSLPPSSWLTFYPRFYGLGNLVLPIWSLLSPHGGVVVWTPKHVGCFRWSHQDHITWFCTIWLGVPVVFLCFEADTHVLYACSRSVPHQDNTAARTSKYKETHSSPLINRSSLTSWENKWPTETKDWFPGIVCLFPGIVTQSKRRQVSIPGRGGG